MAHLKKKKKKKKNCIKDPIDHVQKLRLRQLGWTTEQRSWVKKWGLLPHEVVPFTKYCSVDTVWERSGGALWVD
jgi:hypothetical protein